MASTFLLRNLRILKRFQKILMLLTGQVWQLEVPCFCRAMTVFAFWMPTDLFPLDQLWILPDSRFPVYWGVGGAEEWVAGGKGLTSSPLYDFQCCLPVGPSFPTGSRKALPFPTQGIGKKKVSFCRLELSLELTSPKFRQNESERIFQMGCQ